MKTSLFLIAYVVARILTGSMLVHVVWNNMLAGSMGLGSMSLTNAAGVFFIISIAASGAQRGSK